jgi:hypothetical protein
LTADEKVDLMELDFVAYSSQFAFSISVEELAHFLQPLEVGAVFFLSILSEGSGLMLDVSSYAPNM